MRALNGHEWAPSACGFAAACTAAACPAAAAACAPTATAVVAACPFPSDASSGARAEVHRSDTLQHPPRCFGSSATGLLSSPCSVPWLSQALYWRRDSFPGAPQAMPRQRCKRGVMKTLNSVHAEAQLRACLCRNSLARELPPAIHSCLICTPAAVGLQQSAASGKSPRPACCCRRHPADLRTQMAGLAAERG